MPGGARFTKWLVAGALLSVASWIAAARPRGHDARAATAVVVRVGALIYTVRTVAVRAAPSDDHQTLRVRLERSNATQAAAGTADARMALRVEDAGAFGPSDIVAVRCDHGDDCSVLDPGEARVDDVDFVVPRWPQRSFDLLVAAGPGEVGSRAAAVIYRSRLSGGLARTRSSADLSRNGGGGAEGSRTLGL